MFNLERKAILEFLDWLDSDHNQTEVILANESTDDDGSYCLRPCWTKKKDVLEAYEDYLSKE